MKTKTNNCLFGLGSIFKTSAIKVENAVEGICVNDDSEDADEYELIVDVSCNMDEGEIDVVNDPCEPYVDVETLTNEPNKDNGSTLQAFIGTVCARSSSVLESKENKDYRDTDAYPSKVVRVTVCNELKQTNGGKLNLKQHRQHSGHNNENKSPLQDGICGYKIDLVARENRHNELERKRRIALSKMFNTLRDNIPSLQTKGSRCIKKEKVSKVKILTEAKKYIDDMRIQDEAQRVMYQDLSNRNEMLCKRLKELAADGSVIRLKSSSPVSIVMKTEKFIDEMKKNGDSSFSKTPNPMTRTERPSGPESHPIVSSPLNPPSLTTSKPIATVLCTPKTHTIIESSDMSRLVNQSQHVVPLTLSQFASVVTSSTTDSIPLAICSPLNPSSHTKTASLTETFSDSKMGLLTKTQPLAVAERLSFTEAQSIAGTTFLPETPSHVETQTVPLSPLPVLHPTMESLNDTKLQGTLLTQPLCELSTMVTSLPMENKPIPICGMDFELSSVNNKLVPELDFLSDIPDTVLSAYTELFGTVDDLQFGTQGFQDFDF